MSERERERKREREIEREREKEREIQRETSLLAPMQVMLVVSSWPLWC